MKTNRTYCVPDIHGRLDLLHKLWAKLVDDENLDLNQDKVVFLGDMIDRGPDSYGVVEFIRELTLLHPTNVIALAGNHDWMLIMAKTRGSYDDWSMWSNNGGKATMDSYNKVGFDDVLAEHIKWLANLPFKYELPGYFLSHAPAPSEGHRNILNKGLPEFTPDELTWSYHKDEWGLARHHKNGVIGVSGHIHQLSKGIMEPRFYDHHFYLDCGCGCSDKAPLVAVEINTKKVIYAWPNETVYYIE